ncbi:MAG: hypothetical protein N2444_00660 [Methylocystis sp.]|nr:hypothetical protein [Methylocystis sp.]
MRIVAIVIATLFALSAPAFAHGRYYRHHHHHHHRVNGYAMIAPGVMHTPYGMFLYDDTLGDWDRWDD